MYFLSAFLGFWEEFKKAPKISGFEVFFICFLLPFNHLVKIFLIVQMIGGIVK